MGKTYKYTIGTWVQFKKYYRVSSSDGERFAYEIGLSKPITGQICGAINRYVGKIKNHEYDYHNEYAYLKIDKSITLYQVKIGMINVAHEVKEEDLKLIDYYGKLPLPWRNNNCSENMKKQMAEYAADRVRNLKGEFV